VAKAKTEEQLPMAEAVDEQTGAVRSVTVLYSSPGRNLYKLPSIGVDLWLSVQVYELADFGRSGGRGVGAARTADEKGWRRAYRYWSIIQPGDITTLPADDPLVLDYATYAAMVS